MAHDIPSFENQLCSETAHFVNGKDMFSGFPEGHEQGAVSGARNGFCGNWMACM